MGWHHVSGRGGAHRAWALAQGPTVPERVRPKWDSLARRGPAHGRTSKAQAQRALGLRGTADLLGILVRLGLNDAGRLLSDAQRHLGNPLVDLNHLPDAVPDKLALNRPKVLHRAGLYNPVHGVSVLLRAILNKTERLVRHLLSTSGQDRAGLRHCLEVLRHLAGQLLSLRAVEAQHLIDLVRHAPEGLVCRVQACLEGLTSGLGAPTSKISAGTRGLFPHTSRFIGDGTSCAGRLVSGLSLIVGVVASSHLILIV